MYIPQYKSSCKWSSPNHSYNDSRLSFEGLIFVIMNDSNSPDSYNSHTDTDLGSDWPGLARIGIMRMSFKKYEFAVI